MYKKVSKGVYDPINPEKYIGSSRPIYRSSWEWTFMNMCDNNDHILHWASEPLKIPYYHPVKNKMTLYVPDFLIEYVDSKGRKHRELVEIKPKKESYIEAAKSRRDKMAVYINASKWKAAVNYAENHGLKFRVLTEENIFGKKGK